MKARLQTSLQDICLETYQRDPRDKPDDTFLYIDIASIDRDTKLISAPREYVGSDAPSRARKVIRVDDVIVSTVRPNLNAVAIVPDDLDEQIASTGFCVLRPNRERLLPSFLYYFVHTNQFINYLVNRVSGANYPAVTDSVVKSASLFLPPLTEQERIVRLLDEAGSLRRLRARADARMDDFIPALFHQMFGDPAVNKMGWPICPLEQVCDGKYGIKAGPFGSSLKKESYTTSGYRIYGQEQVIANNFSIGNYYIGEEKFQQLKSCKVKPGDVLISLVGTIGKIAVVPEGIEPGIINPRLLKVTPNPNVIQPEFLKSILEHQATQRGLNHVAHGGTMGVLNAGLLKRLFIILPPLALQQEFAARVTEARALQAQQAQSRARLGALFESMLARAFAGEL
jgi:type I restriction enzyme S subunit